MPDDQSHSPSSRDGGPTDKTRRDEERLQAIKAVLRGAPAPSLTCTQTEWDVDDENVELTARVFGIDFIFDAPPSLWREYLKEHISYAVEEEVDGLEDSEVQLLSDSECQP